MPAIKSNRDRLERATLNTTINKEVFENFKDYCREVGIPMNMVLETFMRQFCEGDFNITLSRK